MGLEPIGVNEEDVVLKEELPAGVSDPSELAASSDIPTSAWEVNAMSDSETVVNSIDGESGYVSADDISIGGDRNEPFGSESFDYYEDRITYSPSISSSGQTIDTLFEWDMNLNFVNYIKFDVDIDRYDPRGRGNYEPQGESINLHVDGDFWSARSAIDSRTGTDYYEDSGHPFGMSGYDGWTNMWEESMGDERLPDAGESSTYMIDVSRISGDRTVSIETYAYSEGNYTNNIWSHGRIDWAGSVSNVEVI